MTTVDVLAIAPHRDDAELTCGGTLLLARTQGYRTGIVDLTRGEMGTRGSVELRAAEAEAAAQVLGLSARENLSLPDAGITNTPETRLVLARLIKSLRPTIVIAPALQGRHPDHRAAAQLVRDACFIAGLAKTDPETPAFRPRKIIHTITYREDYEKPTFVVDISTVFEEKLAAIRCYASQFDDATQAGEVYPNGEPLYDIVRHQAAHYGTLIRARYGEPFWTNETMLVHDVMTLGVSTL